MALREGVWYLLPHSERRLFEATLHPSLKKSRQDPMASGARPTEEGREALGSRLAFLEELLFQALLCGR